VFLLQFGSECARKVHVLKVDHQPVVLFGGGEPLGSEAQRKEAESLSVCR
jgi:hypothetical protein